MKVLLPLLLLTLCLSAPGARADERADERGDLARLRAEAEARYAIESETCRQRFAVNACLDEARIRRSFALKPVEARELQLDAAERHARAEAQKQRVAERQREFAAEEGRRRTAAVARAAASSSAAPAVAASRPLPVEPQIRYRAAQAQRAVDAEAARRNVEQTRQRQQELKARQDAVAKREAEQTAGKRNKPVAPLPIPSAAEVASAAASVKR